MSLFNFLATPPDDPIFGLNDLFSRDPRSNKINLGVGIYKNEKGACEVLRSVQKAEQQILEKCYDKQYPPMLGSPLFIELAQDLIFGGNKELLLSAQTLGGTGALRLACELYRLIGATPRVYLSDPTWPNHQEIVRRAGLEIAYYPYYSSQQHRLDLTAFKTSFETIPARSLVLLQPCCHNPTGSDPDLSTWNEISQLMKKRNLIPLFDLAYSGFDQGLTEDLRVVHAFLEAGHEMFVATSFSKNFGLYGERVGLLTIVHPQKAHFKALKGQLQRIVRGSYSMPPLQGARIVTEILSDTALRLEWMQELDQMRQRIERTRQTLVEKFAVKGNAQQFAHLGQQRGMFCFSDLSPEQIRDLKERFAIYLPDNGRINVAGINPANIDSVANAFISVKAL